MAPAMIICLQNGFLFPRTLLLRKIWPDVFKIASKLALPVGYEIGSSIAHPISQKAVARTRFSDFLRPDCTWLSKSHTDNFVTPFVTLLK
jgi:hypothetical protein